MNVLSDHPTSEGFVPPFKLNREVSAPPVVRRDSVDVSPAPPTPTITPLSGKLISLGSDLHKK